MKKWMWWVLGIIAVTLIIILWVVGKYNAFVSMDQTVKQAWAQVENQLQRRYDLIPNLIETVKGYKVHEASVFADIAAQRAKLAGAKSVSDKISASSGLEGAISRLLVIVENYPLLKADANFRQLMDSLEGTENRISVERMRYNEDVQTYNTFAKRIPNGFFAGLFGFDKEKTFFKAAEAAKEAPKVKF